MTKLQKISKELEKRGIENRVEFIHKNNQELEALLIYPSNGATPTLYEEFFTKESIEDLADEALELYEEFIKSYTLNNDEISKPEFILRNVYPAVCRKDRNEEMLADAIHSQVGETDLEMYLRVSVPDGSFKLTRNIVESAELTDDELIAAALNNRQYSIRNVAEVMAEQMGIPADTFDPMPMNVLTNDDGWYGAAGICKTDILKAALQKFECNKIFIIPSSIHEVLCIPGNLASADDINQMIREVNDTVVEERDVLSDHAYVFDGKKVRNTSEDFDSEFEIDELFA